MTDIHTETSAATLAKRYSAPRLVHYGDVRDLTQNGSGSPPEQSPACSNPGGQPSRLLPCPSDRRLKTNIIEVGRHPLGFGLYLFDYLPDHTGLAAGRQFGVMADEVRRVMPEAVVEDASGFLAVDYGMLGIERPAVH